MYGARHPTVCVAAEYENCFSALIHENCKVAFCTRMDTTELGVVLSLPYRRLAAFLTSH
jgi:hypothetical protein